jgi:hypothetical protein
MTSIPGFEAGQDGTIEGTGSFGELINALYILLVSVGAVLAFLKISIAGAKYAMSDVITSKEDAKSDIKGALIGLAILLVPFIVLSLIGGNQFVRVDVLNSTSPGNVPTIINTGQNSGGPGTPGGGGTTPIQPGGSLPGRSPGTDAQISDNPAA